MASLTQNSLVLVGGARQSSNKCFNTRDKRNFVGNSDNSKLRFRALALGSQRQPIREIRRHWKEENWKLWCMNPGAGELVPTVKIVHEFYKAFNDNDIEKLGQLLSPHCLYQDWIFYHPYEGKENVIGLYKLAKDALGQKIRISIDQVSDGEHHLVTTTFWHLEWEGKRLPYTNGCRFFTFEEHEGRLLISTIKGVDELPIKPGEGMLQLIKIVATALDRYPALAQVLLKSYYGSNGKHEGVDTHSDLSGKN
ncbi:hypothetical protein L6164_016291 [Bauhinia variegata]|uniref:Uncharacterized protein n=1 Tax=Bauhinia variegata TaxID=167791 RepID=A0ACB9NR47_BAUVA|nr:hypothetical protein L6164_016291 [Bauhinia variegata]